jgi:hypothetical protein
MSRSYIFSPLRRLLGGRGTALLYFYVTAGYEKAEWGPIKINAFCNVLTKLIIQFSSVQFSYLRINLIARRPITK